MKIEEAILYLLAERNGGMKVEQLAAEINLRHLSVRKDGQPVSVKQIWYAVKTHSETLNRKNCQFAVRSDAILHSLTDVARAIPLFPSSFTAQ